MLWHVLIREFYLCTACFLDLNDLVRVDRARPLLAVTSFAKFIISRSKASTADISNFVLFEFCLVCEKPRIRQSPGISYSLLSIRQLSRHGLK